MISLCFVFVNIQPNEKNRDGQIPLVVALDGFQDEIAARLMRAMKPEEYVLLVFVCVRVCCVCVCVCVC